jgi:putative ATP-dependent endonuclease of OLD family
MSDQVEAGPPLTATPDAKPSEIQPNAPQIAAACVRISNFRALSRVEVPLNHLTILLGANNAGKSSFLDALCTAVGAHRRSSGKEDIHLSLGELDVPKERQAIIDVQFRPTDASNNVIDTFPAGSAWTSLFGTNIAQDDEFRDFIAIRATVAWSPLHGEYRTERRFLKTWLPFDAFEAAEQGDRVTGAHLDPMGMHYIDAKRDMDEDLRLKSSFWRRMTDDLGLPDADVVAAEDLLNTLNATLIAGSDILKHVGSHLDNLRDVVAGSKSKVDISPVARRLRDLSKGLDVSISGDAGVSFPLVRHGMGTRSLASLLVFQAYASWRSAEAAKEHNLVHSFLALEEPEAHLHPQSQRHLYDQVKAIPAQVVVSTHSPYFVSQSDLSNIRLFRKSGAESTVCPLVTTSISDPEIRNIQQKVMLTRGDLLFARAILLFEGETEEVALPVFANEFWGSSIHRIGLSFISANGAGAYHPFLWLASQLQIPWFIFSDAEETPLKHLDACLTKIGAGTYLTNPDVVALSNGNDFEAQLVADGYEESIERALQNIHDNPKFLDDFIAVHNGQKRKNGTVKDYHAPDGRKLALVDAMRLNKTRAARAVAEEIVSAADTAARIPPHVKRVFDIIDKRLTVGAPE